MDKVLDIIAEEVGVGRDELNEDAEFAEFGINGILAKSILTRISKEMRLNLPANTFYVHPTVGSLQSQLNKSSDTSKEMRNDRNPALSIPASAGPLSIVLQGRIESGKILFLLPDGSGSGMAYARLPQIQSGLCLVALNSPYLRSPNTQNFTVEGIAAIWAEEILRRQPQGPYLLGGWSAGGYYSFEVTKCLLHCDQKVEKLVLIDSPCRAVYEELPMEVVHYLSTNNLMGNWGTKQPPSWLINHFNITIRAVGAYIPTPMRGSNLPDVHLIWAEEGMLNEDEFSKTGLNTDSKVTRMLLQRPMSDGTLGWDLLFPGAKFHVAKMPGNHFTIVYPPNVSIPLPNMANRPLQTQRLMTIIKV